MPLRARQFALLVVANLMPPLAALTSGALIMRLFGNNNWDIVYWATGVLIGLTIILLCGQVLLLGLWTALYDPKGPWSRWALSLLILAGATALFWPLLCFWLSQQYPFEFQGLDALIYFTFVATVLSFILAFIGMLLVHVVVGILRMTRSWRIVMDEGEASTRPQFSLASGMIWMGLVSALLGLSTSFSAADFFVFVATFAAIGTLLAALVAIPAAAMFFLGRASRLKVTAFAGWLVLLSISEGLIVSHLSGNPGLHMISGFAAINAIVATVFLFDLQALKRMGARLVSLKRAASKRIPGS